jgi:hypothetical protein
MKKIEERVVENLRLEVGRCIEWDMGAFLLHKASKTQEASLSMLALVTCSSLNERLTD